MRAPSSAAPMPERPTRRGACVGRLALGALALLLGPAAPARAYEDQASLGVGLGAGHAFGRADAPHGAVAELSGSWGLSQSLAARPVLAYGYHPDEPRAWHLGTLGAELVYLIDVLEVVPFGGLGADASLIGPRGDLRLSFAVHAVLGLDYLLSREVTLSLQARPYLLLGELSGDPVYGTLGVLASWMFDTY